MKHETQLSIPTFNFGVLQQLISAILIMLYTLVDYLTNRYYNLSIVQFFIQ